MNIGVDHVGAQRPSTPEPITITVANAKAMSGLGHTTIYKMIGNGELEIVKVGSRTLITYASLKRRLLRGAA